MNHIEATSTEATVLYSTRCKQQYVAASTSNTPGLFAIVPTGVFSVCNETLCAMRHYLRLADEHEFERQLAYRVVVLTWMTRIGV